MNTERQNNFHADLIEATILLAQKTLFMPSKVWIPPILRVYATDIDNLFCNKQSTHRYQVFSSRGPLTSGIAEN